MKRQFLFLLIILELLLISSCSYNKAPTFLNIEDVVITKLTKDLITIEANAIYFNPNDVGCKLVKTDVEVTVEELPVGKIVQTQNAAVAAKSNFSIPLEISFETKKKLNNNLQILQGVLGALGKQMVDVHYQGKVTYDILGLPYESDFEYSEAIPLKKLK